MSELAKRSARRRSGTPSALRGLLLVALGLGIWGATPSRGGDGGASSPAAIEALEQHLRRAAAAGRWADAVAAAEGLARLRPDSALDRYNLACMLSRAGRPEAAIAALADSADLGFAYTSTVLRDEDLDPVRAAPGFAAALDRVREQNAALLERVKPRLRAAPFTSIEPRGRSGAAAGDPPPLVVALHGTGGTPGPIAEIFRPAAAGLGLRLVAPQGQEEVGRGFAWGIVEQAEYLVEQAIERSAASAPHGAVVLAGFSQGANVAMTMAARHPERYAGVVAVAGWFEERLAPLPEALPAGFPRFALLNGERDEAAANNREAVARLVGLGGRARLRLFPGVGHAFPPEGERDRELTMALRFALGL